MNKRLIASLIASILMAGNIVPVQLMAETSVEAGELMSTNGHTEGKILKVDQDGIENIGEAEEVAALKILI